MNLTEAIKSGKKFRRPEYLEGAWVILDTKQKTPHYIWNDGGIKAFSFTDFIATDFEIDEKKVEITRDQLLRAIEMFTGLGLGLSTCAAMICKELGLE
jgi:hypothetical protein